MKQESVVQRAWAQTWDRLSRVGCLSLDKLPNKSELHFLIWKIWMI